MPSVGTRRTRVFGLRSVDGSRILRSGRRVFADLVGVKFKKSQDFIGWSPVIENRADRGVIDQVRFHGRCQGVRHVKPKRVVVVDIHEDDDDNYNDDDDDCVAKVSEPVKVLTRINGDGDVDRMCGKVYSRKRKRDLSANSDVFDEKDGDDVMLGDRMFGLSFIRRQRSKKIDVKHCERSTELQFSRPRILPLRPLSQDPVLTMFSGSNRADGCFPNVILSVLRHVKNSELGLAKVYAFSQSNPIHEVFASKGMSFLQSYPPPRCFGACVISGPIKSISMFHLDFSAVPLSFMYLHSEIFLRSTWIPTRLVYNRQLYEEGSVEEQRVSSLGRISLESKGIPFGLEHSKTRLLSHPSVRASRLGIQTTQYINSFSSRGVRKKRSLRGTIRPRSYSFGSFVADDMKGCASLRSAASFNRHKSLALRESARRIKEPHSDGRGSANAWKLEFPNRRDGLIYKKCSDRNNIPCSTAEAIPIPGVSEIPGYADSDSSSALFRRPDTYISVNDDEVRRAMAKTISNYDMDSDDEEWLSKFNNELIATDKHHECITVDTFELMIGAFEKESFYGLDGFSIEKAPDDICVHPGSRPVVKAIFTYWMKKRRQRKSSLIGVFEAHQAKKKPIIRRRRSLIRQSNESSTILEAAESRQDDLVNQKAMLKYKEAKAAEEKCVQIAVVKRQRAQLLLKKADAATSKARMAFRVADALRLTELLKAEAAATATSCFMEENHYS